MGEKNEVLSQNRTTCMCAKKAERIRLFNEKQKKGGRYRPPLWAASRNRTGDLFITSETLYRLSYCGVFWKSVAKIVFLILFHKNIRNFFWSEYKNKRSTMLRAAYYSALIMLINRLLYYTQLESGYSRYRYGHMSILPSRVLYWSRKNRNLMFLKR